MKTYTTQPRVVQAIRYTEAAEQQIIEALGATAVNKVCDPKERKHLEEVAGLPTFTVTVSTHHDRKAPSGDYEFKTGDYLVLCDGGFEGEWVGSDFDPGYPAAKVVSAGRFHRLYA